MYLVRTCTIAVVEASSLIIHLNLKSLWGFDFSLHNLSVHCLGKSTIYLMLFCLSHLQVVCFSVFKARMSIPSLDFAPKPKDLSFLVSMRLFVLGVLHYYSLG